MSENYTVQISETAIKELESIQQPFKRQIANKLRLLSNEPCARGKKLEGYDYWRLRSGNYRIIFEIDDGRRTVVVRFIRDRKDAYRRLS